MALFIIGSTLVIYNLNMLSGLSELQHSGTDSARHHWCIANARLLKTNLIIGLILSGCTVWFLNPSIWLLMLPLATLAGVYVLPIIRKDAVRTKAREIGIWKIFLIAMVWVGMTVFLPAVHLSGIKSVIDPMSWILGFERALFILAITIPFDIRDLINDAKKNVRTIPSIIGWKRSVWLAELLLVAVAVLVWFRSVPETSFFLSYLTGILITMAVVGISSPKRSDMYCSFSVEGTMMFLLLMVYTFTKLA